MKNFLIVLIATFALAGLAGCGIKGDLDLPGEREGEAFEK